MMSFRTLRSSISALAIASTLALSGQIGAAAADKPVTIDQKAVQTAHYEHLTRDNAVLLIVDHQAGLYTGVRDIDTAQLKHNIVGLAKAAVALKIPVIVTTTTESMWGPLIPELQEALPGIQHIERTTVNAWDDPRVLAAIKATGRKKLIISGVSTDVCLALPAISAVAEGYSAYAVVDASGSFTKEQSDLGVMRMVQAGVIPVGYSNAAVEILGDNAAPEANAVYSALNMPFAGLVFTLNQYYSHK
ncbi:MAG TPA: isochorismatase family protein [Magnetospirillaceae bacterium]|nr:isochorismatase family protein [Magnetospirillaceae bacterium]